VNPDHILSQLRDLAADATRSARDPKKCSDPQCVHRQRAEALSDRFAELDASLTGGDLIPLAWAGGPDVPAPRMSFED